FRPSPTSGVASAPHLAQGGRGQVTAAVGRFRTMRRRAMKLDSLKPLLHHDGPLTTVCLDATRGDESTGERDVKSRWHGLRRVLEHAGAPPETLAAIEEAVLRPTHVPGPHGRYVVAAGSRVLLDHVLADPPA